MNKYLQTLFPYITAKQDVINLCEATYIQATDREKCKDTINQNDEKQMEEMNKESMLISFSSNQTNTSKTNESKVLNENTKYGDTAKDSKNNSNNVNENEISDTSGSKTDNMNRKMIIFIYIVKMLI